MRRRPPGLEPAERGRFLIFFKGTGKFRSLDVEANFGRKVVFGITGRGRNQIHANTKNGTVRCRYH